MKTIIILGINADIGSNIANFFLNENYRVIGTYRKKKPSNIFFNKAAIKLLKCDLTRQKDLIKVFAFLKKNKIKWNHIFSSVGTSLPIGNFFKTKFKNWNKSIQVNFISQLNFIHGAYAFRDKKKISDIIFLAGGGTNNPFTNYSAYCVSKISLIKMCELIDDENKDLNISIIGPGFTKTKTHLETIKAGVKAGKNLYRVKKFLSSNLQGTSFKKIFDCIKWCINNGKKITSGRNISVVHDDWGSDTLKKKLLLDKNMYKLRRFKN